LRRVSICTLGCKANQADSAALAGLFRERGYEVVEFPAPADVYVINTCTVTHLGDKKSRQMIRRAVRANPDAVVVVTGCYAQVAPEAVAGLPGVRLVVGTAERGQLVDLVEEAARTGRPRVLVGDLRRRREFEELGPAVFETRARAWVKIQDGCENFCTYCVVPRARGPVRSRRPESVLREVERLLGEGYGEIVLTGIHIGAYGQDLGDTGLVDLLRRLVNLPGLRRMRLSSIEPPEVTPELIRLMADSAVICRHLHIPLQSADDGVLRRMGRRYTGEEYRRLVEAIKKRIPGVAITTDVMVGFPGEDEEAFRRTREFVETVGFARTHVFQYSRRPGTPAAGFADQVPPAVKEERSREMIAVAARAARRFAEQFVGVTMEVLVERPRDRGWWEGLTDNYLRVLFRNGEKLEGGLVAVRLIGLAGTVLLGEGCEKGTDRGRNCGGAVE